MSNQVKSETKQCLFVYVVRWRKRVDGEYWFGNLCVCYTNEKDAEKAMLDDMEDTMVEWQTDEDVRGFRETLKTCIGKKNENNCATNCSIWFDRYSSDYLDWFIDKIELVGEV